MLFTTSVFWIFLIVVLILLQLNYYIFKSINFQNICLLTASYIFYGYWDWRFLSLIFFVSFQTYVASIIIHKSLNNKKLILFCSIFLNLLILGYFKYADFFVSEFLNAFNLTNDFNLENIILPVGISFYIFQSFTYVIDVYLRKINPEKNPLNYFTFIAFFPQLVAGPIERASTLLPQFQQIKNIKYEQIYLGIKICSVGLFLKIFIADNVSESVDLIFSNYQNYNGGTLLLGALGFTIQIYGDFAGYSLIAIGVAKIMGFNLMRNFNTPYFSISIQDFWRRWHISLSTFFRDYIYIPLGGSMQKKLTTNRNIFVTFVLSGVWHGANWTFLIWGIIHGLLLIFQKSLKFKFPNFLGWFTTMSIVVLLWILFRSETIYDFYLYINNMFYTIGYPEIRKTIIIYFMYYFLIDLILFHYKEQGETWFGSLIIEVLIISFILVTVIGSIESGNPNFIYFQF